MINEHKKTIGIILLILLGLFVFNSWGPSPDKEMKNALKGINVNKDSDYMALGDYVFSGNISSYLRSGYIEMQQMIKGYHQFGADGFLDSQINADYDLSDPDTIIRSTQGILAQNVNSGTQLDEIHGNLKKSAGLANEASVHLKSGIANKSTSDIDQSMEELKEAYQYLEAFHRLTKKLYL